MYQENSKVSPLKKNVPCAKNFENVFKVKGTWIVSGEYKSYCSGNRERKQEKDRKNFIKSFFIRDEETKLLVFVMDRLMILIVEFSSLIYQKMYFFIFN